MGSFTAQVEAWTAKAKANMEQVILGSIEDLFELATRRQASITETGTYKEGFVPVDLGNLIGSARIAINGAVTATGTVAGKNSSPPDFTVALAMANQVDTAALQFTAAYAQRIEYGFSGPDKLGRVYNQPGRFFVRNAVMQWQAIVDANARYIGS